MRADLRALAFAALGTACSLYGVGVSAAQLEAVRLRVLEAHRRWTRFEPGSHLSRLNASAGAWVEVDGELESVLRFALAAWKTSCGLVHAGVERCLRQAGYGSSLDVAVPLALAELRPAPLPPLPAILQVLPGRARVERGFGIDLGGLAKGWLADSLVESLGANCLVNLGGDLRARGPGPDGQGWPVEIGGQTVLLRDHGAATSGSRRRRWGHGLHHVIDPRTGLPAGGDLELVSVVAATAAEAEVLAKAALIAGRSGGAPFLATAAAWWVE